MALIGVAPAQMKPTALALNVLVASLATVNFRRAGVWYPRALLPFAVGAVPAAFVGGHLDAGPLFKPLVAVTLVWAALRTGLRATPAPVEAGEPAIPTLPGVAIGAIIGLIAGVTGTGGGIFLSPVLAITGWATVRQSAGISAAFIVVTSIAGGLGHLSTGGEVRPDLLVLAAAAGVGGFLGSWAGAHRLPEGPMQRVLSAVLLAAAIRLVWPG